MANMSDTFSTTGASNGFAFHLTNPTAAYQLQASQMQQTQRTFYQPLARELSSGGDMIVGESRSEIMSEAASSPDLQGMRDIHSIDPTLLQLNRLDKLSSSPPVKQEIISPELRAVDPNQQQIAAAAAAMAANIAAVSMGSPPLAGMSFEDDLSFGFGTSPPNSHLLTMQQLSGANSHPFASGFPATMVSQAQSPLQLPASLSRGRHRSSSSGAGSSGDEMVQSLPDTSGLLGTSNASVPPIDMKVTSGMNRYLRYAAGSSVGIPITGTPAGASLIGGPGSGFQSMSMPVHLGMGLGDAHATADWFGSAAAVGGGMDVGSFPGMHAGTVPLHAAGQAPGHLAGGAGSAPDHTLLSAMLDEEHRQAQLQYEKRRRRRESHNAVERRRRDNINERIQELSTLVPDCSTDPNNKPNKGAVLRKSVDYIRQMQQMMQQQIRRNQELEAKIAQLQRECGIVTSEASTNTASTSETTTTTTTTTTTATTTTPASTGLNLMSTAAPGTPMATSVASISTDPVAKTAVPLAPMSTTMPLYSGAATHLPAQSFS